MSVLSVYYDEVYSVEILGRPISPVTERKIVHYLRKL